MSNSSTKRSLEGVEKECGMIGAETDVEVHDGIIAIAVAINDDDNEGVGLPVAVAVCEEDDSDASTASSENSVGVDDDVIYANGGNIDTEARVQAEDDGGARDDDTVAHHATAATLGIPITDVIDAIGIEVFKYLQPKELFHFSLTSHCVHEEVSKLLIQAYLRQIPSNFWSEGRNHYITINDRHSYYTKDQLLEQLLEKVRIAELKLSGAEDSSVEGSMIRAREVLNRKAGARFVSYNSELPEHLRTEYTSAGYNYEVDNKELAISRSNYIFSRLAMAEEEEGSGGEDNEHVNYQEVNAEVLAKKQKQLQHISNFNAWINYIISQRHVVAGTWFWSCRHRNLDFQGVEGKGVMISSPQIEGEEMEIMWTRLTHSRV